MLFFRSFNSRRNSLVNPRADTITVGVIRFRAIFAVQLPVGLGRRGRATFSPVGFLC